MPARCCERDTLKSENTPWRHSALCGEVEAHFLQLIMYINQ
jgi:hypothetical protein